MSAGLTLDALLETLPDAAKDLRLNLGSLLGDGGSLTAEQKWGIALACAFAARNPGLIDTVLSEAKARTSDAVIDDARAANAVMAMNNVFYRFRHYVGGEYETRPARLRMNRIGKLAGAKLDFELMCLAVSAVNGCEVCVKSHEQSLKQLGATEDHVLDAARIAANVHGVACALESIR